ncbi:substrate-binding domain-containing protein [Tepidicella baoligensis]|uniref:substrate-binding domain-containing protein n=1 Tax=Tepidicella baoligensis TaxID=2707016 RepID=UPI001FE7B290|nr:substrate-binding domain-containing protein [Tepidicella baoligensis]
MTSQRITGISSMATRQVLAELAQAYRQRCGVEVVIESVGGVDAARRVQAGEAFDAVFLAADALDKLAAAGHVLPDSRVNLMRSGVAVAVREGAERPDISSEATLRNAVLQARSLSVSTGPSGVALLALFERWGLMETLRPRLVTPPPGVPVASLVASGEVELGFQQLSEMLNVPGIALLGGLPAGCEIVTVFAGAVATASTQPDAVRELLTFMAGPETADAKRRQGMEPA